METEPTATPEVLDRLPTPVARSMARALRSQQAGPAEQYLALGYLSEVLLKYVVLTLHTCIKSLDDSAWTYWGYRLSRAEGLGEWEQALVHLEAAARMGGAGGWAREILDWLSTRRTGKREVAWFSRCYELVESLWTLARGSDTDYQRSVRGLLSFLVSLRNRTRGHGAFPPDFYREAVPLLSQLLTIIIENATPLEGGLLWCEEYTPEVVKARVLRGPVPTILEERRDCPSGLVLEDPDRTWAISFSPLLLYRPSDDGCFFANGKWNSANVSAEGLDYYSGEHVELPLGEFRTLPAPRPRSQTAGRSQLAAEAKTLHNLPTLAEGYVDRPSLEASLKRLLGDQQHRIITLHGMGGTGKTSLALRVAWQLVREVGCPFELVLWFSARDIDLLVEGPQPREREVRDIEGIAEAYCKLLGGVESAQDALRTFAEQVADPSNRYLLIMDNFETLDDPVGVHQYLDETVVMPNKVLITSRHRAFKGDYPVEVSGMELGEAEQLLKTEARRVACEPQMTAEAMRRIHEYTGGVPYAMKLVVGQIARKIPLTQILNETLSEDRLLDALFLRSYRALSEPAKRLFLVVGNVRSDVDAVVARAVFAQAGLRFDEAVDELERTSLVDVVEESNRTILRMPQVTKNFAARELPLVPSALDIRRDLSLLRGLAGARDSDTEAFARRIAGQIRSSRDSTERQELGKLIEALAAQDPRTWRVVAGMRKDLGDSTDSVREAYRMAVRHEPNDPHLWQEWSRFEEKAGDHARATELLVRAAESAPDDIELNSSAAGKIAWLVSQDASAFSVADRAILAARVKRNLEERFEQLDATTLSRLAWLYLLERDERNAERCARHGLSLEPENTHCKRILERLGKLPRHGGSG